jgi:hypothetical protein
MGDETNVVKKQQEMPIPNDPLSDTESETDDFIDDEVIYESEPQEIQIDDESGTGWNSGHRVSLRARSVKRDNRFGEFRLNCLREKQKEMNEVVETVSRMTKSKEITESEGCEYLESRFGSQQSQPSRMKPLRSSVLIFESCFEQE